MDYITEQILKGLFGIFIYYSWGHLIVLQYLKGYKDRTLYEKFITNISIITLILFVIGNS